MKISENVKKCDSLICFNARIEFLFIVLKKDVKEISRFFLECSDSRNPLSCIYEFIQGCIKFKNRQRYPISLNFV